MRPFASSSSALEAGPWHAILPDSGATRGYTSIRFVPSRKCAGRSVARAVPARPPGLSLGATEAQPSSAPPANATHASVISAGDVGGGCTSSNSVSGAPCSRESAELVPFGLRIATETSQRGARR